MRLFLLLLKPTVTISVCMTGKRPGGQAGVGMCPGLARNFGLQLKLAKSG